MVTILLIFLEQKSLTEKSPHSSAFLRKNIFRGDAKTVSLSGKKDAVARLACLSAITKFSLIVTILLHFVTSLPLHFCPRSQISFRNALLAFMEGPAPSGPRINEELRLFSSGFCHIRFNFPARTAPALQETFPLQPSVPPLQPSVRNPLHLVFGHSGGMQQP